MRNTSVRKIFLLAAVVLAPGLSPGQATATKGTELAVKGYSGQAPLIQIDGKSYVEVEALARLTNGTLSFKGNQVTLALAAAAAPKAIVPPPDPAAKVSLSKEFLRAGIEEMSVFREWRVALLNAIQSSAPITQEWIDGYGRNAEAKLELASAAVAKSPDRDALPLLRSQFSNLQKLSGQYVAMHNSLTYITPDSLDNDPLEKQVLGCENGWGILAASGQFQDVPECH